MFDSNFDASAICEECTEAFDHPNHKSDAWPNHRFRSIGGAAPRPKSPIDSVYDDRSGVVIPPKPEDKMWKEAVRAASKVPKRGSREDRSGQVLAILGCADRPLPSQSVVAIVAEASGAPPVQERTSPLFMTIYQALESAVTRKVAQKAKCKVVDGRASFCYSLLPKSGAVLHLRSEEKVELQPAQISEPEHPLRAEPERVRARVGADNPYSVVLSALQSRADKINAELLGIENAIRAVQRLADVEEGSC